MSDGFPPHPPSLFIRRFTGVLVITVLFLVVVQTLWLAAQVLLLIFASILLAVVLRIGADFFVRFTRMPARWALSMVIVLSLGGLGLGVWVAAPRVAEQVFDLRENLHQSIDELRERWAESANGGDVFGQVEDGLGATGFPSVWERAPGIFSSAIGAMSGLIIFLIIGVFLAYSPQLYVSGLLRLIPLRRRARACEVITALGVSIRGWLMGQIISMALLFFSTWLMLWLLGIPLAFILALLTGVLTFVPYLGPIIAFVPIVLVAFIQSPSLALYVTILYLIIQNLEANVIMPLVFQRTVDLPPVLTIAGQLVLGSLLGVAGFILATPLTAAGMVIVRMLYVQDALGDNLQEDLELLPEWQPEAPPDPSGR